MKGKWIIYYLFIGMIVIAVLSFVGSYVFTKDSISNVNEKHVFESIYIDTDIDFIIPSPSYEQISELESETTGIDVVTPYYETTTVVKINGVDIIGNTIIIPDINKVEYSPYNSKRIIDGEMVDKGGTALIDHEYMLKNNCSVGDRIEISIAGQTLNFEVVGVTETNTLYEKGSIALILDENQASVLKDERLVFSAAFVKAGDASICESFLKNDYKPYGRMKKVEDFESEEVYQQHIKNFESADWSQEITNFKANYESLKVSYNNTENTVKNNSIIYAIIISVVIFVLNLIYLVNASIRKAIQTIIVKKGFSLANVKGFYISGLIVEMIVFVIINGYFYYSFCNVQGMSLVGNCIMCFILPVISMIVTSIVMILTSIIFVQAAYKVKKSAGD